MGEVRLRPEYRLDLKGINRRDPCGIKRGPEDLRPFRRCESLLRRLDHGPLEFLVDIVLDAFEHPDRLHLLPGDDLSEPGRIYLEPIGERPDLSYVPREWLSDRGMMDVDACNQVVKAKGEPG